MIPTITIEVEAVVGEKRVKRSLTLDLNTYAGIPDISKVIAEKLLKDVLAEANTLGMQIDEVEATAGTTRTD
jgi:hypothetical protein